MSQSPTPQAGRQAFPRTAGLFALAFQPTSIEQARTELSRRRIPHSVPFELEVTYADDPHGHALDEPTAAGSAGAAGR